MIIFLLKILQFTSLFLSLIDLFDGPDFFILQHSDSVSKQLHISLKLKSDRSSLIESQILTLDVDDDVRTGWTTIARSIAGDTLPTSTFIALSQ